ncbi:UNVERIFIED_CONTAM: hypothetical protein PYX00_009194 [Menopon gallinae]|uniref:Uncharacterized protein n=1 Tax=Menopon gallinae TaxID=328185 RepID=A0AAW2HAZ9_9NEOP
MKSLVLLFAVVASSVLLAEGVSPDVHDPSYRKTTSYIEKGDYLDAPQHGSGLHKHSDKNPHHDDSHSHEDSSEHRRHARDADDDVETRRLGGGSYSDRRPGSSSLGSGSYHQGSHGAGFGGSHGSHGSHGSGGLGGSHSGLGSGALHSGSHRPGSGLGSGSFYQGSSGSGHNRRPSSARLD